LNCPKIKKEEKKEKKEGRKEGRKEGGKERRKEEHAQKKWYIQKSMQPNRKTQCKDFTNIQ
jgi:hypothetical protein